MNCQCKKKGDFENNTACLISNWYNVIQLRLLKRYRNRNKKCLEILFRFFFSLTFTFWNIWREHSIGTTGHRGISIHVIASHTAIPTHGVVISRSTSCTTINLLPRCKIWNSAGHNYKKRRTVNLLMSSLVLSILPSTKFVPPSFSKINCGK